MVRITGTYDGKQIDVKVDYDAEAVVTFIEQLANKPSLLTRAMTAVKRISDSIEQLLNKD